MKKIHILLLAVVAICIAAIVSTVGKSTTYAVFDVASSNIGTSYHIIGKLNKSKPMEYDPIKDPNYFTFYMTDTLGVEKKVVYRDTKPMDMEQSEKIVVIGEATTSGDFEANEILKKCPSKYTEKPKVAQQ
jgi:cytochrome c-type biogenesis protein CcmE